MIRCDRPPCESAVFHPRIPKFVLRFFSGRIARGSAVSLAIKIAALGLGFLQAILMARLLGPEGYGAVAVALSVVALMAVLSTLGLAQLAVREIPRALVGKAWAMLRGFVLSTPVCVGAAAALIGLSVVLATVLGYVGSERYRSELVLAGGVIPIAALLLLVAGIFQGLGRIAASQLPRDILLPLFTVTGLLMLLALNAPIPTTAVISIVFIAAVAALVVAVRWLRHHLSVNIPAEPPQFCITTWLRQGAPFLTVTILGVALNEVNTLLLGWLTVPAETGLFQPLLRISSVMLVGLAAVLMAFAPRAADLHARDDREGLISTTRITTIATTLVTTGICAAIILIAPWILALFGREFTVNASSIAWIAGAQIFNTGCGPVGTLLMMAGYQKPMILAQATGLAANVVLGVWLIPKQGAHGAVLGMCGGIVVWNLLALISVWRLLGFDPSLVSAVIVKFQKTVR